MSLRLDPHRHAPVPLRKLYTLWSLLPIPLVGNTLFTLFHLTVPRALVSDRRRINVAQSSRRALPPANILQAPHISPPNSQRSRAIMPPIVRASSLHTNTPAQHIHPLRDRAVAYGTHDLPLVIATHGQAPLWIDRSIAGPAQLKVPTRFPFQAIDGFLNDTFAVYAHKEAFVPFMTAEDQLVWSRCSICLLAPSGILL
jgi:hypothetical protein